MDKATREIVSRVARHRNMPTNTCPASRHAEMIGEHLVRGQPYAMLTEEPDHCGGSILSAVGSLYEARTERDKLRETLKDLAAAAQGYLDYCRTATKMQPLNMSVVRQKRAALQAALNQQSTQEKS